MGRSYIWCRLEVGCGHALIDRFLIDEYLSAALVAAAKARGFEADHVTHIGKTGWQDWNLVSFAIANNYIFVTSNRRDFLKLYAKLELHSGLIVIIPKGKRDEQRALFGKALQVLAKRNDDLINTLVEILPDGQVTMKDWNLLRHDIGHIRNPKW